MTINLQQELTHICEKYNLKEKAFENFEKLYLENYNEDPDFLNGYKINELKPIFDGYTFGIQHHFFDCNINTRISLYLNNEIEIGHLIPIGYYILEANFEGEIVDDYFVMERTKYLDDINIVSHFQHLNKNIPLEYFKRNHIQYQFVSYLSLSGTLFVSGQYEMAGRFVFRAYVNLHETGSENFEKEFLKKSKNFLKMMKNYLKEKNLI
ncbi:hypothetical protein [Chryseobacterium sp. ERMR1:04]|uniref:hypothetical protein n=1 Tax=Chryseobacterium sp. ERMR1:04 TaxID=1705393 RepID=UPI0006C8D4F4|nr:hypothetical protein [Chryseobacterium sp. ERMR1:04]KPH12815.1 hypothetical protein AMQ68_14150 [Chryseobacterium sp. ERMR1:04]